MNANDKDFNNPMGTGGATPSAMEMYRSVDTDALKEDLPPMRAASIRSPPATVQFSTGSETGFGEKFSKKRNPPFGASKLFHPSKIGIAVKREWNECKWKVSVLNEAPLDFPLERTRREICEVPVTEVVDRISRSLRLLSIEAEFDGENGKAKCTTSDSVNFRIRLFAGDSITQEPVIVEIQRRSGSPRCFMGVCKKVLDAAEGVEIQHETVPARKKIPPLMMKKPISEMRGLKNTLKLDPQREVYRGITKSLEMLRSKKKEVNLLGLENLCFMTDPLKTRPDMAMISCKAIISGDYSTEIRDEVGFMLKKDLYFHEDFEVDAYKELFKKRRHLAVAVLSNVLALTSQDGCLADAVQSQEWFTEFLIPSLLDEVKHFEVSSNNAYEAACGLTYLASCSDIARRIMKENSAIEDLQAAKQFAMYHHELLALEAQRSLGALGHPI
mmetsp:Transcript_12264/g.28370  ORF Transcript_12264/g.28370 Transcript_12264/m.28370 type:complete len:443 (-) Transcript_12264:1011-2339(-)|eukprot:CAMPEP_0201121466 /NCGR_PEP_ID=MMETSP0850-20130426/5340_1 /ASSEMBLY_ACC=CAM_ASM_000622 /TAXON_ID=183588 /ORGANISM="Pseudo-nitzschia fraudulenta, Strain WWA7" /LENGTH=442 /DNA_ID=CAMNT_0047387923 /DNA_START=163 /DNA_END=1491 /DNA_ORIENTATION=-